MNINIKPSVLKSASRLLCEQVTNGNCLVDTKVRDNGNIIEWHLANGDVIEVINNMDYSTGIAVHTVHIHLPLARRRLSVRTDVPIGITMKLVFVALALIALFGWASIRSDLNSML